VLEGDAASFASGVSRDGRRVSGLSIGPDRIRACVWDRRGDAWEASALPHTTRLGSHAVAISGNGKIVAAVDGTSPCLWTQDSSGRWTREVIGDAGALIPRAVNDAGVVVGLRFSADGMSHAVIRTGAGGCQPIKEPAGYVLSEANAVNNRGVVVGMLDGPHGSKIGPSAFLYEGGKVRVIDEGGPLFDSATAINDRGQIAGVLEEKED
jgi:uncharacterized membrane protein